MGKPSEGTRGILPLRRIDPDALKVVRKLLAAGHEAYLVGGCVRDLYLGLRPKDFDVATSATPEAIRRTFRNSRIIGRRFKLAHVYFGPKIIETATFRAAPPPSDGDPLIVADNVWGSIEDDARRRDFTINGLFFDVETQRIVDFVAGIDDLDDKVVRTIGDPALRFQEDPVRMIRAIKFAARLGFEIEEDTWSALLDTVPDIAKCSGARVLEEIYKVLRGGASRRSFELLLESGLLGEMMTEYVKLYNEPNGPGLQPPGSDVPDNSPGALLWRFLDALDEYVRETSQVVSNGVLQACLFAPLVAEQLMSAPRRDLDRVVEQLITPPCAALGVARRDRELARQILMATRRMMGQSGGRRRRRPSMTQRQYFHDALIFLGVWVKAGGNDDGELAQWRELSSQQAEKASDDGPPPSSRRRRGGRRSRRSGGRRQGGKGRDAVSVAADDS